jgi:hypothetical protein
VSVSSTKDSRATFIDLGVYRRPPVPLRRSNATRLGASFRQGELRPGRDSRDSSGGVGRSRDSPVVARARRLRPDDAPLLSPYSPAPAA